MTQVNLFVHGPQVGTGSVLDIRARVMRRHPPLTGSWLCSPMAGAVTAVPLMYDLDDAGVCAVLRAILAVKGVR